MALIAAIVRSEAYPPPQVRPANTPVCPRPHANRAPAHRPTARDLTPHGSRSDPIAADQGRPRITRFAGVRFRRTTDAAAAGPHAGADQGSRQHPRRRRGVVPLDMLTTTTRPDGGMSGCQDPAWSVVGGGSADVVSLVFCMPEGVVSRCGAQRRRH